MITKDGGGWLIFSIRNEIKKKKINLMHCKKKKKKAREILDNFCFFEGEMLDMLK